MLKPWDHDRDQHALVARLVEEVGGSSLTGHLSAAQVHEIVVRAWMMGATVARNTDAGIRVCRICGCWQLQACAERCCWVAQDLCSTCVPIAKQRIAEPPTCGRCSRQASAPHFCEAC